MTTQFAREVIEAVERCGLLQEAGLLRDQKDFVMEEASTGQNRSILKWMIAKVLEEKLCTKAPFPCAACVREAESLVPTVILLIETGAIYSAYNIGKEGDVKRLIAQSFNYSVSETKKHMMEMGKQELIRTGKLVQVDSKPTNGSYNFLDRRCTPKDLFEEEEPLKIIRISERGDANPVLRNADETND